MTVQTADTVAWSGATVASVVDEESEQRSLCPFYHSCVLECLLISTLLLLTLLPAREM